eukprot:TRINITY_DN1275_c0_g1_i2.p1 TRINITY_DN1275_c0_g1~~TRINITY_DN1275_c0_g1_i2.p1  ORF type:complete len:1124 (-),score=364.22 TRINITY_DN1275_c0_g1_i2:253-3624(-)
MSFLRVSLNSFSRGRVCAWRSVLAPPVPLAYRVLPRVSQPTSCRTSLRVPSSIYHTTPTRFSAAPAPAASVSAAKDAKPEKAKEPEVPGTSYADLTVGVPREIHTGEKRVALSPENVGQLLKKGFKAVYVERGAGAEARYTDDQYTAKGATIVDTAKAFDADIVLKVRAPEQNKALGKHEAELVKQGGTFISLLFPGLDIKAREEGKGPAVVDRLAARNVTAFAMDQIPRISRAQVYDALSSQANIAGLKAVVLAGYYFERSFQGGITAAGRVVPPKVLVIGAGVAGLAAIGAAKKAGAIVRASDPRPATREQVVSMGGEFLETKVQGEEGKGGYAKEQGKDYQDAQTRLFEGQCKEVDIIITTALIPGRPAPKLITDAMVKSMKPGSVIIDLAAETGGNCEASVKDQVITTPNGVTVVAYTDLPSRMSTQASMLYGNNITKFLTDIGGKGKYFVDVNDEVVRGALVLDKGAMMWPAPSKPLPSAAVGTTPTATAVKEAAVEPTMAPWKQALLATSGLGALLGIGITAPPAFTAQLTTFALACVIGYKVVWGVSHSLHSPLMSVTNAVSGIVAVAGMHLMGKGFVPTTTGEWLAAASVLMASVNIAGGFLITKRMLDVFKKKDAAPTRENVFLLPGAVFGGAYLAATAMGYPHLTQMGYLTSSILCILALGGLNSVETARLGNVAGILGVGTGLVATCGVMSSLGVGGFTQMAAVGAIGGGIGYLMAKKVNFTDLPQLVAGYHSLVGLAAVLTSAASFLADAPHFVNPDAMALIQKGSIYLGTVIGGITFTGSLVAFGKLQGVMSSKPLRLPAANMINMSMALANAAGFYAFMTLPDASIGVTILSVSALLSFAKGYTLSAAIGGADMPVVVTLLNSYSGWALCAEGFMLQNDLLVISGALIGASGAILSYIMCRGMNRSLTNVIFGGYEALKAKGPLKKVEGSITETRVDEVADWLMNAKDVVITPGYGMCVAKAQGPIAEMTRMLKEKGIKVRFAIHEVAGRMPGQLNVLLGEAGISEEDMFTREDVHEDLPNADLVLVIGANDVVNSLAVEDENAPIYGMPVLKVWEAKQVVVMKRSMASGYADIENPLFFKQNAAMLFGDAKKTCDALRDKIQATYETK